MMVTASDKSQNGLREMPLAFRGIPMLDELARVNG
jgi:hypothetical protein